MLCGGILGPLYLGWFCSHAPVQIRPPTSLTVGSAKDADAWLMEQAETSHGLERGSVAEPTSPKPLAG